MPPSWLPSRLDHTSALEKTQQLALKALPGWEEDLIVRSGKSPAGRSKACAGRGGW